MNPSPIFPSARFTSESWTSSPENIVCQQGGVALSIVLAESTMFVEGFNQLERMETAPAMLRGTLVVNVSKPTKLKSVSLAFKGQARTEWPEGIPPKRVDTLESDDVHCHVWNFYNAAFPTGDLSSGADLVRLEREHRRLRSESRGRTDSHQMDPHGRRRSIAELTEHELRGERHSRRDSVDSVRIRSESTHDASSTASSLKFLTSKFRRSASPAGINLSPNRSFSKNDTNSATEDVKKGYRIFEPGEYMYNFELAIPQSVPETIHASYGSVHYFLEATAERSGTFRSNLVGRREIPIIRAAGPSNLESSEPISISKDWEDQLHYEIAVGGKSFSIGSSIPVSMRLVPLSKSIKCHRVRVYVTETVEYYCRNKKVHRVEPTRKFLIYERQAERNGKGTLLHHDGSATDLEYRAVIPENTAPSSCSKGSCSPFDHLRPNTGYDNIQVHHWLKIVMRLSRPDPKDEKKQKFYEISIDSPISLLDKRCTMANLALPQYTFPSSINTLRLAMPTPLAQTPGGSNTRSYEDWPMPPPTPTADMPPPTYEIALQFGRHVEGEERPALHRTTTTVREAEDHDDTTSSSNTSIGDSSSGRSLSGGSLTGNTSVADTEETHQPASTAEQAPEENQTTNHDVDDDERTSTNSSSRPHSFASSDASFLDEFPADLRRPLLDTNRSVSNIKDAGDQTDPELGQYASEAWIV